MWAQDLGAYLTQLQPDTTAIGVKTEVFSVDYIKKRLGLRYITSGRGFVYWQSIVINFSHVESRPDEVPGRYDKTTKVLQLLLIPLII